MRVDDNWRVRFDWRNGDAFDLKMVAQKPAKEPAKEPAKKKDEAA
jgi:hypothetical protein